MELRIKEIDDLVNEVKRGLVKQDHEDGITPAIGHPLEGLTRGTTTHLGQELSAIWIQIAEVPLMGSQLAEKRQFGHLALDGARVLARSTLPEPLEGRPAVRGLGLEQTVELGSPLGAQQGLDRGYVLSCARPRAELTSRTIRSGAGKTSLSVRSRSRARRKRTFGASCSRVRSSLPSFEFFQVP